MSENSDEVPKSNEQCDETFADLEEKSSTVPINSVQFGMLEKLGERLNEQEKFNKESLENQQKLLEKFESMQNQLTDLKNQMNPVEELIENKKETVDDKPDDQEQQKQIVPLVSKQFVLKRIFKNVSRMERGWSSVSSTEEHFGVQWTISFYHRNEFLAVYLQCMHPEEKNWSIEADFEVSINGSNGKNHSNKMTSCCKEYTADGFPEFVEWDVMKKECLVNDELRIEVHVKVMKTTGVYKDELRCFDESMKKLSDMVLVVQNKKFYISKLTLAAHSTYFESMFLGMFEESKKSEIALTGVDADDFQKYLEVVYGEYAIDEITVEGILLVADMYDTGIVIRKCEEFLLKESGKTLKKKLEMSVRYHLENLKNKCLSEIKTIDDIRSVTPDDIQDMDPSLVAILFQKSLALN